MFKYRQELYRFIVESLLNKTRLNYSRLYDEMVVKTGKELSHRDYTNHLKKMIAERVVQRDEIVTNRKIPNAYYSLTKKALKEEQLKILGIDKTTVKRRGLYQLLIFFEIFKRTSPMTTKQLKRFLGTIGASLNDLREIKTSHTGFPRTTFFKVLKGVSIMRLIQTDFRMDDLSDTFYYASIPGFTIKEFISHLRKLKKGSNSKSFPSYPSITDIPIVSYNDYTEEEVTQAVNSFREDGLIRPINEVFPSELRFDFVDESLKNLIKDIWLVHDYDLRLLIERLAYDDKPRPADKKYLALLLGEKNADKILPQAHNVRNFHKKNDTQKQKEIAIAFIEDLTSYRESLVHEIINKYENIMKKYEIIELIEGICISPFLPEDSN